jgi:sugar phosphate isomerase/epimerase
MNDRRKFINTAATGLALTAIAGSFLSCKTGKAMASTGAKAVGARPVGLQLWTLRDEIGKDPKGVLKQVADMGYKQIESFEGAQGIYWGMTNTDFKKYMDDLGMTMVSSHCDMNKDFEKKAAEASAIGMKYLLCPAVGKQKSLDEYKKIADTFNEKGEICKKAGLKFGYHNHDYSFMQQDGQFPQDIFMQNTNKDNVDYEMDMYWVVIAGQNPLDWYKKYPGRFKLGHIKDRKKDMTDSEKHQSVIVGQGSIDYAALLPEARKYGLEYFIVEQEEYEGTTPIDAAKADAQYLNTLSF